MVLFVWEETEGEIKLEVEFDVCLLICYCLKFGENLQKLKRILWTFFLRIRIRSIETLIAKDASFDRNEIPYW